MKIEEKDFRKELILNLLCELLVLLFLAFLYLKLIKYADGWIIWIESFVFGTSMISPLIMILFIFYDILTKSIEYSEGEIRSCGYDIDINKFGFYNYVLRSTFNEKIGLKWIIPFSKYRGRRVRVYYGGFSRVILKIESLFEENETRKKEITKYKILESIRAVGVINIIILLLFSFQIGGNALNGKISNDIYYVLNHGEYLEVGKAIWYINKYHTLSNIITFPLTIVSNIIIFIKGYE